MTDPTPVADAREALEAALLIDESDSASVDPREIFDGVRAALSALTPEVVRMADAAPALMEALEWRLSYAPHYNPHEADKDVRAWRTRVRAILARAEKEAGA